VPLSFRIDASRRRVEAVANGPLLGEEIISLQREVAGSPGFDPDFDVLFDFTSISAVQISAAQINAIADQTPFGAQTRRAYVTENPVAYGLSRMFDAFLGDRSTGVEIFADRAAAELWLDRK
jgi:hypothetical protein